MVCSRHVSLEQKISREKGIFFFGNWGGNQTTAVKGRASDG